MPRVGHNSDITAPISRPDEIRDLLPGIQHNIKFDATFPPEDEATRQAFIRDLEVALNDKANRSIWLQPLVVPDDYKALISLTDGEYTTPTIAKRTLPRSTVYVLQVLMKRLKSE